MTSCNVRVTTKTKHTEKELTKRIKDILLCHFMVGTIHLSLCIVVSENSETIYERIMWYMTMVLSARRYIMFVNDFKYIHSKKFDRISQVLRYENIPYCGLILVSLDGITLLYRFLHFFIHTDLHNRDHEMIIMCAYVLIPVLILFMVYTAIEEKTVYQELLHPSIECEVKVIFENPDAN